MIDKTPSFVADTGAVSSGGLKCTLITCVANHVPAVAPHATHVSHFLAWLFG